MTDGDLVRATLRGDGAAYEELVRRWASRVLALCHGKVGRAPAAEDLAQEALMRGYAALASLSDPAKFGPWLCGIATRACLDWLKARARTQVTFSDLSPAGVADTFAGKEDDPGREMERRDDIRRLLDEVEALPEEYRKVLMLYYYEDVTYRDMAELLGVSAATVNARLTKARALLRRRLSGSRRCS